MRADHAAQGETDAQALSDSSENTKVIKAEPAENWENCGEGRGVDFLRPFSVRPLPDKEPCVQEHDLMCGLDLWG